MIVSVKYNEKQDWYFVREEVFIKEQGFHNEFDDIDDVSLHITIYEDHELVGCGRIYSGTESGLFILGRIAVLKPFRNRGYGIEIIKNLEEYGIKHGANVFQLDAQQRVLEFYKQLGYEICGEIHFDEHVPHICMKKIVTR